MRPAIPALRLFCLCLALPAGLAAEASRSAIWSAGGITLTGTAAGYRATTGRGEARLKVPTGVEVEDLFPLRQGAFVAGLARPEPAGTSSPDPGRTRDLFLARLDERGLSPLPTPSFASAQVDRWRENAVPMTTATGDLAGVAWLEGADRQSYAVRTASWTGKDWSAPVTIAPAAPGSQLALSGATLGDGTRLLVWARFDGQDDEIVASRFVDGAWSEPQPLAAGNSVPDVTPSVVAVPGGALAAWSRYDGHDYRVVVARFDGVAWTAPAWAGPPGSTWPSLQAAPKSPSETSVEPPAAWLSYADAGRRGWAVVELAAGGRTLRQGTAEGAPSLRPALLAEPDGALRLRWADREREIELK